MTEVVAMSDTDRAIETGLAGPALLDAAPIARPPADLATPGLVGLGLPPGPPAGLPAQVRMSDAGIAQLRDLVTPSHGCSCGGKCAGGKDCGCGAGGAKAAPTLVYALGTIGFDFPLLQSALPEPSIAAQGIEFSEHLLRFFDQNPFEAEAVTWTLNRRHAGLRHPAGRSLCGGGSRCASYCVAALGGAIGGARAAGEGRRRPRLPPRPHCRDRAALVRASRPGRRAGGAGHAFVVDLRPPRLGARRATRCQARRRRTTIFAASGLGDFLSRIYFDLRNLGVTPEDRALNYAATNAFQARQVVEAATVQGLDLERITVHKSSICRPDFGLLRRRGDVLQSGQHQCGEPGVPLHRRRERRHSGHHRRRAPMDPPGVRARTQVNCVASPALQPTEH